MNERLNEEENIGPMVRPPRKLQSEAEHIHRAVFLRAAELRKDFPGSNVQEDFQDREPRATLWAEVNGELRRKEFFESVFTADEQRFLEEYVRAARECGNIAVLYPGLSFPEEYVIRKIGEIFDRIRRSGVERDVQIDGYLYDYEGRSHLVL